MWLQEVADRWRFSFLGLITHSAPPNRKTRRATRSQATKTLPDYEVNFESIAGVLRMSPAGTIKSSLISSPIVRRLSDCSSNACALLNSSAVASLRLASALRPWDRNIYSDRLGRDCCCPPWTGLDGYLLVPICASALGCWTRKKENQFVRQKQSPLASHPEYFP